MIAPVWALFGVGLEMLYLSIWHRHPPLCLTVQIPPLALNHPGFGGIAISFVATPPTTHVAVIWLTPVAVEHVYFR
jgi:hypothetical protein